MFWVGPGRNREEAGDAQQGLKITYQIKILRVTGERAALLCKYPSAADRSSKAKARTRT